MQYAQTYTFDIVSNSNYNFTIVAIPSSNSTIATDIFEIAFTLTLPAGSADVENPISLLSGRAWTVTQYDAAFLTTQGLGDSTLDVFKINMSQGQTLLSHTTDPIELVSFDVINSPTTGVMSFLLNSDPIAIGAGVLDGLYSVDLDGPGGNLTGNFYADMDQTENSIDFSTLGIENLSILKNIKVFPNPTKGMLYIKGDVNKLTNLEVFSITGQKVMVIKEKFREIDISALKSALYFVILSTEDSTKTLKIIKE